MKRFLIAICAAGLLFSGCGSNKPVEKPAPKVETPAPAPVQQAAPDKVLNLGMTLEQFKAAYNENIAKFAPETGWNINLGNLKQGIDKSTFEYQITPNVSMFVFIETNTGFINQILILMFRAANEDEITAAMLAYGMIMPTLNPELDYNKRGELLGELKFTDNGGMWRLPNVNGTAIRGKVRYTTMLLPEGDFWFMAEGKDLYN